MSMSLVTRSIVVLAVALAPGLARAQGSDIVDVTYVRQALAAGAVVWDVRAPAAYEKGHLPGALSLEVWSLREPSTDDWLPIAQLEHLVGEAGLDLQKREVITCSSRGDPLAHWALTFLRYFGAKRAKVFHGGVDDWRAAGLPIETEPTKFAPLELKLTRQPNVELFTAELLSRLKGGRVQLIDARTPAEFSGQDVRAIRGGHIPGAINIPFERAWVNPEASKLPRGSPEASAGRALKPLAELKPLFARLDPAAEVIVYCQAGVRASQQANVMRALGFQDVKVYEPSWLGYAGTLSAPAEAETFFNPGPLLGRVSALEAQVEELTKKLAERPAAAAQP
jgi:thiosulfate/3-mercaptopyruvate sulfurtransferase